jgi:hypothetical protein
MGTCQGRGLRGKACNASSMVSRDDCTFRLQDQTKDGSRTVPQKTNVFPVELICWFIRKIRTKPEIEFLT